MTRYSLAAVIVAGTTAAASVTATAQEPSLSAQQMLQNCGAALKQADGVDLTTPDEAFGSIWCIGYIQGFLDGQQMGNQLGGGKKVICIPPSGITNDQAIRIFVKHLRANPESLHQSGRMELMIALKKAFPCGQ